jgi:hypothetical protein
MAGIASASVVFTIGISARRREKGGTAPASSSAKSTR